jgi:iron complex transport system substrate-binding protein
MSIIRLIKRYYLPIIIFILLPFSCKNVNRNESVNLVADSVVENTFAKGFKIEKYPDFKIITVYNPWQHAHDISYKYILSHTPEKVPDSLRKYDIIPIPARKIVCLSTTHLAFLSTLNEVDAICGVSAPDFVYDSLIRQKVDKGTISNVGYDQAMNIETIIGLKPDFVMAYGVGSEVSGQFQRLKQLGIKVVFNGEYLENTPLGKAEWLKFMGAFFDKEDTASLIFNNIVKEYTSLSKIAASAGKKPVILSGLPWKGVWYVPGGKSYAANFIYDAGGDYLWKDDKGSESIPLSLETVMERANQANIWINPGSVTTLGEIPALDQRMKEIKSFKENNVYNFTARITPGGGNDFWESGVVHPDWILKDLIAIFHPEMMSNHKFVYYKKLN